MQKVISMGYVVSGDQNFSLNKDIREKSDLDNILFLQSD